MTRRPPGRAPRVTPRLWLASVLPFGPRQLLARAIAFAAEPLKRRAWDLPAGGAAGASILAPFAERPVLGGLPLPGGTLEELLGFLAGTAVSRNRSAFVGWPPSFAPNEHGVLWDHELAQLDPLRAAGELPADDEVDAQLADLLKHLAEHHPPASLRLWPTSYVVASRLQTLIDLLDRRPGVATRVESDERVNVWLAAHLRWITSNPEDHIPGNHVIRLAQALVLGGTCLAPRGPWRDAGLALLEAALEQQLLPDGGQFERAPTYHALALRDLLQAAHALERAGHETPAWLTSAILRMRAFVSAIALPDDTLPPFGDSTPGGLRPSALGAPAGDAPMTHLADSGFVVTRGAATLVVDVGPFAPDNLPAHGHADLFSFVMYLGRYPVIVDPGTFTYEPGERRQFYRGTPAHSTMNIDGQDSTEVWGRFRAGRRARPREVRAESRDGTVSISGWHAAFHTPDGAAGHARRLELTSTSLSGTDRATGRGQHTVELAFPLAPGIQVQPSPDARSAALTLPEGPTLRFHVEEGPPLEVEEGRVALDFNREVPAPVLVVRVRAPLPLTLRWRIDLA